MTVLGAVIQEGHDTNTTALVIFIVLFGCVTGLTIRATKKASRCEGRWHRTDCQRDTDLQPNSEIDLKLW